MVEPPHVALACELSHTEKVAPPYIDINRQGGGILALFAALLRRPTCSIHRHKSAGNIDLKGLIMATNSTMMIWADDALARALALTKNFEPVRVWDNEARAFTDDQDKTDAGVPVWESEALIPTGWGAKVTPVRVRMASQSAPTIAPDPVRLMASLGLEIPHGGPSTAMPAQSASSPSTRSASKVAERTAPRRTVA